MVQRSWRQCEILIGGTPEVWLDGDLHRLQPGDAVAFPAGTGFSHTFINNTDGEVRLLVIGEHNRPDNRVYYPRNPERQSVIPDWWHDVPRHPLGEHDGLPDQVRAWKASKRSS